MVNPLFSALFGQPHPNEAESAAALVPVRLNPVRAGTRGTGSVAPVVNRNALRAGAVSAVVTLLSVISTPAFALIRDDGDEPGPKLSVGETLGIFLGLPVLSFVIIAGLVMLPDIIKKKQH